MSPLPRRRPFEVSELQTALMALRCGWREVKAVAQTGSTNADAAAAAGRGALEGWTLVADEQTAGRGRLDRQWVSPPAAGIAMSVVVRPKVAPQHWTWLPLLAGLAVVDALRSVCDAAVSVKWPNDIVFVGPDRASGPGPRKLGGILCEQVSSGAVVVGIGLNIDHSADELPTPQATSLALECAAVPANAVPARELVVAHVLSRLEARLGEWYAAAGDASGVRASYLDICSTIGQVVRLHLPDGHVDGVAVGIDDTGRLLLRTGDVVRPFGAGDVVHLRAGNATPDDAADATG